MSTSTSELVAIIAGYARLAADKRRDLEALAARLARDMGLWQACQIQAIGAAKQSARRGVGLGSEVHGDVCRALYAAALAGPVVAAELQSAIGPHLATLEQGRADYRAVESLADARLAQVGRVTTSYGI